ncbi:MAG: IclR family transcriptional regulator [Solirubrobacterales bacterium]|nr:IclR family transcriptional regulator [Solirubrobacterales bacterium]
MRNSVGGGVLERAARLLEAFREGGPELTLSELVARSEVPRATAHRLAGQLVALGFLERSRRGWRLGTALFELGQIVPRQQRLRELALPYMEDLYEATKETVQLGVLDQGEVLYVEIIAGHRRVSTPSRRGGRMPAHCTGLGKALLAFSPDVGREWLAAQPPLMARTPSTIIDPARLARELQDVRRAGVAFDREEARVGLVCLAAPILGRDGVARAALSVSMPTGGRISPAQVAPAVVTGARAVSRELARAPGP